MFFKHGVVVVGSSRQSGSECVVVDVLKRQHYCVVSSTTAIFNLSFSILNQVYFIIGHSSQLTH